MLEGKGLGRERMLMKAPFWENEKGRKRIRQVMNMARSMTSRKSRKASMRLVSIIGARRRSALPYDKVLDRVRHNATALGLDIQLVDASKVFGREHLEIAADMAARTYRSGRGVASTLLVEFVRFASGKRQISEALMLLGISDATQRVAACLFHNKEVRASSQKVLEGTGLVVDENVWGDKDEVAAAFGLGKRELEAMKGKTGGWRELVIERMALMDLGK
jgi:KEOPS complex subunit Cgi121